jgi:hypothetical protein
LRAAFQGAQNSLGFPQNYIVIAAHFYPQPKRPDAIGQGDIEVDLVQQIVLVHARRHPDCVQRAVNGPNGPRLQNDAHARNEHAHLRQHDVGHCFLGLSCNRNIVNE